MSIAQEAKEASRVTTSSANTRYPFQVTEVAETNGRLLAFAYRDIYQFGRDLLKRISNAPQEFGMRARNYVAVYEAWPYGYKKDSGTQEEESVFDGFVDHGAPQQQSTEEIKRQFNKRHAEAFASVLQLEWHDLFALQDINTSNNHNTYFVNDLTAKYPSMITEATIPALAAQADTYLTALKNKLDTEHSRYDAAIKAYRWLKRGAQEEIDGLQWRWDSTHEALEQLRDYANTHDVHRTIYVAVEDLEKKAGISPVSADLSIETLFSFFEHLAHAGVGTFAGTYNTGEVVLNAGPVGDPAFLDGIKKRLARFADTKDMLERADRDGVTWILKKIPAELAEAYRNGEIRGTLAAYNCVTNTVTALQPPRDAEDLITPIESTACFAHELRHAGRHFNNPDVYIEETGAKDIPGLCEKLLRLKLIEADARTDQIYFVYQCLTDGGTQDIDESTSAGMAVFETLNYVAILDYHLKGHRGKASYHDACKAALAEVFINALQNQGPYENKPEYFFLVHSSDFPAQWQKTVDMKDRAWVARLTAMKSLGGETYLPDNNDALQAALDMALLKTIPAHQVTSEKHVRRSPAMRQVL